MHGIIFHARFLRFGQRSIRFQLRYGRERPVGIELPTMIRTFDALRFWIYAALAEWCESMGTCIRLDGPDEIFWGGFFFLAFGWRFVPDDKVLVHDGDFLGSDVS